MLALVVPEIVCATVRVLKSVLDAPVSEENAIVATVVVGAVVSTATLRPVEPALALPAVSVALAVSVCAPSPSALVVIDQLPPVAVAVPSTVVPSVSYSVTADPASAVPVIVGVVLLVMPSVLELPLSSAVARPVVPGVAGAVLSTVTLSPAEAALVPDPLVVLAVSVCDPSLSTLLVIDQLPAVALAVPSTVVPSVSYKVTVAPASAVPV
jgi:hypothetical protein